jgi:parallel beta-helix repeat protein
LVFVIIILFFGICVTTLTGRILEKPSSEFFISNILYVGGNGPSNFTSIQEAIDNSSDGYVVFIYDDSSPYYENVIVDKSINLIGEDKNMTIIDADKKGHVMVIKADKVSICNLTFYNSGIGPEYFFNAAMKIISSDNIIQNIRCLDANYGIIIQNSDRNVILNNYIEGYWDGITLDDSENNFLRNNSLYGSGLLADGKQDIDTSNTVNNKSIYYYYKKNNLTVPSDAGQVILVNCNNFIIENMKISGATVGISIFHSNHNIIRNNIIDGNTDFGIRLYDSNNNLIVNNQLSNNPFGIGLAAGGQQGYYTYSMCNHNKISRNNILHNINGLLIVKTNHNTIVENNFIGNKKGHVRIVQSFFNSYIRNYWDNWIGIKLPMMIFFPKFLPIFYMQRYDDDKPFLYRSIPIGLKFDWDPAHEKYDINNGGI